MIHTDNDGSRWEDPCDQPLIIDRTQSVIAIVLYHHKRGGSFGEGVVFVIRAAALIKHLYSTRSGPHVPWDDWKGDVMIVEIPNYVMNIILGTRVLLMTYADHNFQAYDFSRWGCRGLVGDQGEEKRTVSSSESVWSPNEPNDLSEHTRVLGGCLVTCTVGDSQNPLERAVGLRLVCKESSGFPSWHTHLGVTVAVTIGFAHPGSERVFLHDRRMTNMTRS